ncbi:MAG: imm11 family protein [Gemmatimonadaceae bacterium]
MRIFELKTDPNRYCDFALSKPEADGWINTAFDGRPLANNWTPVQMQVADQDDSCAELADYALLGTVPVFSAAAVDVLLDLLRPNGELLPLRYPRKEYMAYNVTRVTDALDEQQSSVIRFTTGRVMSITKYVFNEEALINAPIFKITQLPLAYVFVSDVFVKRIQESSLTGFIFRPTWVTSRFAFPG